MLLCCLALFDAFQLHHPKDTSQGHETKEKIQKSKTQCQYSYSGWTTLEVHVHNSRGGHHNRQYTCKCECIFCFMMIYMYQPPKYMYMPPLSLTFHLLCQCLLLRMCENFLSSNLTCTLSCAYNNFRVKCHFQSVQSSWPV